MTDDLIGTALRHAISLLGPRAVADATGKTSGALVKETGNALEISLHDACALAAACEAEGKPHRIYVAIRQQVGRQLAVLAGRKAAEARQTLRLLELVSEMGEVAEQYRASLRPNGRDGRHGGSREGGKLIPAEALAKIAELRHMVDNIMVDDNAADAAVAGEPGAAAS